tara:strand:- start:354 stop:1436 length:1083 start_codon:yes stop_codon:yes gene_type:complete
MQSIIVLGGGMVGSAIARDLKESNFIVSIADKDLNLKSKIESFGINFKKIDFANKKEVFDIIENYDLVIGAVPGFLGRQVLGIVLNAKKNYVDISFMSEDSKEFNDLAKKNELTVITDAGVAPGLSNLLYGRALSEYDVLTSANCYVGGLPQNPEPPWFYKSVFSPIDVVEEYTRPARFVKDGKLVVVPAMTDIETIKFEGVGELDAFNSDGLRSLIELPIPNMIEKTLRFPGHIQKIIKMRDEGMFEEGIISRTASDLIAQWAPSDLDYDQTVLRLEFNGTKNGKEKSEVYNLIDYFDKNKKISSMARTTGYTCSATARLILEGSFSEKGIFNLETLGLDNSLVDSILLYLSDRNIQFN